MTNTTAALKPRASSSAGPAVHAHAIRGVGGRVTTVAVVAATMASARGAGSPGWAEVGR